MNSFTAIDFETLPVPFFNLKGRNHLTASGHPRLATPILITLSDGALVRHATDRTGCALPSGVLVFHNAGFDVPVGVSARLWTEAVHREREIHCTWLMSKVLRNDRSPALKSLAQSILGETEVVLYKDVKDASEKEFIQYAEKDALYTAKLFPLLSNELRKSGQWDLYQKIELPFLFLNLECERNGFLLDRRRLQAQRSELLEEIEKSKALLADPWVNWNSPKQIQRKVFGDWNQKLTYHKGKLSTSRKALKNIASDDRVANLLRLKDFVSRVRQLETLARFIDSSTGAIHPYINTVGAGTGRCTSSCPNLQNIPKESSMRELFLARPEHRLVVLDFSQIEPRVLAHFIHPSGFSRIFFESEDFYSRVAREVFSSVESGVPARAVAKQVVLATFYGMGAKTLGENLKVSQRVAQDFLDKFFSAYPEIERFRNAQVDLARSSGYAEGLFNRRRYISGLNSDDDRTRFAAKRQVLNAIIQGSATSLFKLKLVKLRERLPESVKFLLHIHDEVVLEAPESIAIETYFTAKRVLEEPEHGFLIPLQAEGGVGATWADAKTNQLKTESKGGGESGATTRIVVG